MLIGNIVATESKGAINGEKMKIDFVRQALEKNDSNYFLQVHAELFLCAKTTGVCKKKSVEIRLNLTFNEISSGDSKVYNEFNINAN